MPYGGDFFISSQVWDQYWGYYHDTLTDHSNTFQAMFSDGNSFVDIDSITNQFISLNKSLLGQYASTYNDPSIYPSNRVYNWSLYNYLDSNFSFDQTLVPRLTIVSPGKRDTVSKTAGFTINYNGSSSAKHADIVIYQAGAINLEMGIDDSADPEITVIQFSFSDNGSISVPSSKLSSLIPNRYYRFNILHFDHNNIDLGELTGTVFSSASVSHYFYLTN